MFNVNKCQETVEDRKTTGQEDELFFKMNNVKGFKQSPVYSRGWYDINSTICLLAQFPKSVILVEYVHTINPQLVTLLRHKIAH